MTNQIATLDYREKETSYANSISTSFGFAFWEKRRPFRKNICEIASALSPASIGPVDKIFVFVTGDIGFSGKKEQYTCFRELKTKLITFLKQHVLADQRIHIYLVPGNHDIDYDMLDRDRQKCEEKLINLQEYDLSGEVKAQSAFLRCSSHNYSLSRSRPYFIRNIVDVNGFTIEINLLNSTIFSLRHENDQGIHFLTDEVINQLAAPTLMTHLKEANLCVT